MDIFKKSNAFGKKTISTDPYSNDMANDEEIKVLNSRLNSLQKQYNSLTEKHQQLIDKFNILAKAYKNQVNENADLKKQLDSLESSTVFAKKQREITDTQIMEIKKLRELGLSYRKISKETKWSICTISRVINGYYD